MARPARPQRDSPGLYPTPCTPKDGSIQLQPECTTATRTLNPTSDAWSREDDRTMENPPADSTFEVFVDDNFHYMDPEERYSVGKFTTYAAALEHAKSIVDRSLVDLFEPGKSAADLMASYVMFGEDPFIVPTPEGTERFSARDYARRRAPEIVDAAGKP